MYKFIDGCRPAQVLGLTISGVSEVTLVRSLAPKLALLHALAEEGNLTRAAATLGPRRRPKSRWLGALSAELGTPVVVPDGRGIRLSRIGASLAQAAGRTLSELATEVRQATDEADPERGSVVLAFLYTLGERRGAGRVRGGWRGRPPRRGTPR